MSYSDQIEELLYSKTDEKKIVKDLFRAKYAARRFQHVLDVGPGPGTVTQVFAEKSDRLTLVEVLGDYEQPLRARFPDAKIIIDSVTNVRFLKDIDLILLNQCLYYLPAKEWIGLCRRLIDSLIPGGELVIVLNDHGSGDLKKIFDRYLPRLGEFANFAYRSLDDISRELSEFGQLSLQPYDYVVRFDDCKTMAETIGRQALEISDQRVLDRYQNDFLEFASQFREEGQYVFHVRAGILSLRV